MNKKNRKNKKTDEKFHTGIVIIASIFVLIISFFAYMINTDLEDVLEKEYGDSVVTHQTANNGK